MAVKPTKDALLKRMAELLAEIELYGFDTTEHPGLARPLAGWMQIKGAVAEEIERIDAGGQ